MICIRPILMLLALLGVSLLPGTMSGQPKDEKQYPPPPWHLVDIWWDIGQDTPFESYSIDVTISDDVPSTVNLYIAPIGIGHLSKTPFYGGIQTQADGYTKRDQHLRKIGPGFLFSMWGERSLDAIRPSIGGFCQSSGHEGDFVSVRRPYEWKKGKYTYKVVRMDREEIDGKPVHLGRGVRLLPREGRERLRRGTCGSRARTSSWPKVASFVEIYGRRIPVEEIPKVTVTFGNPDGEREAGQEPSAHAIYPKRVARLRRRRGEGRCAGRHGGQAGRGSGETSRAG